MGNRSGWKRLRAGDKDISQLKMRHRKLHSHCHFSLKPTLSPSNPEPKKNTPQDLNIPSLHASKAVHANLDIYRDIQIVLQVTHPLRTWYAKRRKEMRNREGTFCIYTALAAGADLQHIHSMFECGGEASQLERLGLQKQILTSAKWAAKLNGNSPYVGSQDMMADRVWGFRFNLMSQRLQQLSMFMWVPPYTTILLGSDDQKARPSKAFPNCQFPDTLRQSRAQTTFKGLCRFLKR